MRITFKIPHVSEDVDRHGNVRLYYKPPGAVRKTRIRATPGTPEFASAIAAVDAALAAPAAATAPDDFTRPPAAGTWRWLCQQYMAHDSRFLAADAATRRARLLILQSTWLEPVVAADPAGARFADFPLDRLGLDAVEVLLRRKAATPSAANNRRKCLNYVFAFAVRKKAMAANPARDAETVRPPRGGHHSWSEAEIIQFEQRHPKGTKAYLALHLFLFLGLRKSDAVRIGRQHRRQARLPGGRVIDEIHLKLWKNRNRTPVTLTLPVLPVLADTIAASPVGDMAFIVTEYGRPFTVNGFGNWFRDRCNEAGLTHCSAHGLRKAGAVRAAHNGATTRQLMDIFGWLSESEATLYTRAAEQKRMAAAAMHTLLPAARENEP